MSDPCNEKQYKAIANEINGAIVITACEVETQLPIPDELREPKGIPEQGVPPIVPEAILLWNHPVEVVCTEPGSIGDTVVIQEHYKEDTYYLSEVLTISEEVLKYIAENKLEQVIASLFHEGKLTAKDLHKMTGMKLKEATDTLRILTEKQNILDTLVYREAVAMLSCYWLNTAQTAECEDKEAAKGSDDPDAVFSATIPAGSVTSFVSQDDADRQAYTQALAMLNCFYINDPFTALCEERPDKPTGADEPVPNDTEPIYTGRSLRVGRVEVPKGKFKSTVSKEAANLMAENYGYSLLVCWYPNMEVEVECEDKNARNKGVDYLDPDSPAVDADIVAKTHGQHVVVPVGFITSELSTEQATNEAEMYALGLLECCFLNHEFEVHCDYDIIVDEEGNEHLIPPSDTSPVLSYVVPRGKYVSCFSQEDADQMAQYELEGALDCRYCNLQIMPKCVPDWVLEAVREGRIALPLKGPVIEDRDENGNLLNSINVKHLPINATRGIDAGQVCDLDAMRSQQLASSLADIEIERETDGTEGDMCLYYNDLIIAGCQLDDPYGNLNSGESGYTPDGDPYIFWSLYEPGTCLSENLSVPKPGTFISIPPGMYSAYGKNGKEQANADATRMIASMLVCMFENPPVLGGCQFTKSMGSLCSDEWRYGKGKNKYEQLTPWSHGREVIAQLPRGSITRRGYGNDQQAVYNYIVSQVVQWMESMLVCMYCNRPIGSTYYEVKEWKQTQLNNDKCNRRTILGIENRRQIVHYGEVPECTFVKRTPEEADASAAILYDLLNTTTEAAAIEYCTNVKQWGIPDPSPSTPPGQGPGGGEFPPIITPDPSIAPAPSPSPSPSGSITPSPTPSPSPIPCPSLPPLPSGIPCCYYGCPNYVYLKFLFAYLKQNGVEAPTVNPESLPPTQVPVPINSPLYQTQVNLLSELDVLMLELRNAQSELNSLL